MTDSGIDIIGRVLLGIVAGVVIRVITDNNDLATTGAIIVTMCVDTRGAE